MRVLGKGTRVSHLLTQSIGFQPWGETWAMLGNPRKRMEVIVLVHRINGSVEMPVTAQLMNTPLIAKNADFTPNVTL